jgi:hypothetical protein
MKFERNNIALDHSYRLLVMETSDTLNKYRISVGGVPDAEIVVGEVAVPGLTNTLPDLFI